MCCEKHPGLVTIPADQNTTGAVGLKKRSAVYWASMNICIREKKGYGNGDKFCTCVKKKNIHIFPCMCLRTVNTCITVYLTLIINAVVNS